ncbi:anhydro-N-acetylmuramic acid kinase [Bacillaceae bacterium W0354]
MSQQLDKMTVCGLMSGTSLDGVDVAIVELEQLEENIDFKVKYFNTVEYDDLLKGRLQNIVNPNSQSPDISSMNMLLGEVFANAVIETMKESGIDQSEIDLISSHGQTIFHETIKNEKDKYHRANTLQIGDISVIAELTGIPTIGDFRTRDVAVGGQGAPLVPFADFHLFRSKTAGRALVNIGGITNFTILPPNCEKSDVIAYDTGPGNMMIDAFVEFYTSGKQSYDANGELAAKGQVNDKWLSKLLAHPYFAMPAPKSTGREEFGKDYAKQLWKEAEEFEIKELDRIATITALTAHTLANELNKFINNEQVHEVYISGGGVHNETLLLELNRLMAKHVHAEKFEILGMSSDAKEAVVFALLGYLGFQKRTNNLPRATGAKKDVVMGKISW